MIAPALVVQAGPLTPQHLWEAWTFEPMVVLGLAGSALLYAIGRHELRRRMRDAGASTSAEAAAFWAGWTVLAIALVSPIHQMGEALFAAHMIQHELLMVVAAPLLVLGRPLVVVLWALAPASRQVVGTVTRTPMRRLWAVLTRLDVATGLQLLVVLGWHLPALYQWSVRSELVHAAQHSSFLGTALLFWWAVFHGSRARLRYGAAVLCLFLTTIVTSGLGALLTVAPHPLYPIYATTSRPWGLSPLEDQELAGLIMWIPAALSYLVAALWLARAWLAESDRRVRRWESAARRLVLLLLVVAASGLVACGRSPEAKAQEQAKKAASWRQTIRLTHEARARGAIPEVYAQQMLDAAALELRKLQ
ncbi:MAG TPA: cytochrome c oxidase assembly protein [Gemmatimonadales bacterium]|nr:cytochrome c oxidase assembly protein [Gemmatimonadales bacterium]